MRKCRVLIGGQEVLACQTAVNQDMTVTIPDKTGLNVLQTGVAAAWQMDPVKDGYLAAFDIGTNGEMALAEKIEFLELASLPEFSRTFAKSMNFREGPQ